MKTTIISMLSALCIICMLAGCEASDQTLVEKLRKENDSLRDELKKVPGNAMTRKFSTTLKRSKTRPPFPKLSDAAKVINDFRTKGNETDLYIPASMLFLASDFETVNVGEVIAGFRLYPIIEVENGKDLLKYAGVPVNEEGEDIVGTEDAPYVFNFAEHCPTVCAANKTAIFDPAVNNKLNKFKKIN